MGKPGVGNLPKVVHLKQTRKMVYPTPYGRIYSQLCHAFHNPKDTVLSDDEI